MTYVVPIRVLTLMVMMVSVAFPQLSLASNSGVLTFAENADVIPKRLIRLGYSKIGRLDLRQFVADGKRIQVREVERVSFPVGDGETRSSAFWLTDDKGAVVHVSKKMWKGTFDHLKPMIALHEFLGAQGFSDPNYELSTSLWMLSNERARNVLRVDQLRSLEQNASDFASRSGGGVIGVGGGGDWGALALKEIVLSQKIEQMEGANASERTRLFQYIPLFISIGVEMQWGEISR